MKKLYKVDVIFSFYALAEDENDACDFARQAIDDADLWENTLATEVSADDSCDWEDGAFVYHDGREDITIKDAWPEQEPEEQEESEDQMRLFEEANEQDFYGRVP